MTEQQPLYFDEFFGSDDNGVEITLPIRGRQVPLRIRRGLTLREKSQAQARAIKRHIDPKTGRLIIDSVDEAGAAEEVAFQMLLAWPFVNRADGSPVPITRENVALLLGGLDALVELTQKMEEAGEEALAPFVSASASPSVIPVLSDQ
jgi:hypothetical protein